MIRGKSQYYENRVIDKYPVTCKVTTKVGRNRLSANIHSSHHVYLKLWEFVAGFEADATANLNTSMKDITIVLKIA